MKNIFLKLFFWLQLALQVKFLEEGGTTIYIDIEFSSPHEHLRVYLVAADIAFEFCFCSR